VPPTPFARFLAGCGHANFPLTAASLPHRPHRRPVGPHRPTPAPADQAGTSGEAPRREIVNAILYIVRAGCAWRMLPKDFPPWQTVLWYFCRWRKDGTVDRIHNRLRDNVRDAAGRDPLASASVVDAQSVKGADTVGADSRGFDAAKKVNGRKRHIVVDTLGLLLIVMVTAANVQDRDGGRRLVERLRFVMPSVAHIWADGATSADWSPTQVRCCAALWRSWARGLASAGSRCCLDVG
jgi:transposase